MANSLVRQLTYMIFQELPQVIPDHQAMNKLGVLLHMSPLLHLHKKRAWEMFKLLTVKEEDIIAVFI